MDGSVVLEIMVEILRGKLVKSYIGIVKCIGVFSVFNDEIEIVFNDVINIVFKEIVNDVEL